MQERRATADAAIATDVDRLNIGLQRIEELNTRIAAAREGSDEMATLQDMRQAEIDAISEIVPIRLYERENGKVAIMTTGGQILLDGSAAVIGFTRATAVDPTATVDGILSGLTVNGEPVATPPGGPFEGGRLAANFEARDVSLVTAQSRLDAIARDLIERLSGGDADPTLAAGEPGLVHRCRGSLCCGQRNRAGTEDLGERARRSRPGGRTLAPARRGSGPPRRDRSATPPGSTA